MVSLTSHWSHPPTSFKLFSLFHLGFDHVQLIIVLLWIQLLILNSWSWTESIFSVLFITIFQCFNFFSCKSVITERWQWTILSQRWSGTKWKSIIYKKQSWKKVFWILTLMVASCSTFYKNEMFMLDEMLQDMFYAIGKPFAIFHFSFRITLFFAQTYVDISSSIHLLFIKKELINPYVSTIAFMKRKTHLFSFAW